MVLIGVLSVVERGWEAEANSGEAFYIWTCAGALGYYDELCGLGLQSKVLGDQSTMQAMLF